MKIRIRNFGDESAGAKYDDISTIYTGGDGVSVLWIGECDAEPDRVTITLDTGHKAIHDGPNIHIRKVEA